MGAANDRYPVPMSDPFVRYEERIRQLERRIGELTGARPMQHTAMTGGSVKVLDPASTDAVVMGRVSTVEGVDRYGLELAAGGAVIFEVNSVEGWRSPALQLMTVPQKALGAGPFVVTTSATFEPCYKAAGTATHLSFSTTLVLLCPAATTGEVRIRHGSSGTTTGTVACPASSQVTATFRWLHAQQLGSGPHSFYVEGRRASGAGSVQVFWPDRAEMSAGDFASTDGVF